MRRHLRAISHRLRDSRARTPRARRILFESLEDRATPAVGFGYALSLGAAAFDEATTVAADGAGNVYVAGSFNGTVDFDRGPGTFALTAAGVAGTPDAYLAKYDPAGALLWAGQIVDAGPINGYRLGLAIDAGGAAYLTGQFAGTVDFDFGPGTTSLAAGTRADAFVARYTPAGGLAWARALHGDTASLLGIAVAVDGDGNVYTAGVMGNGTADLDPSDAGTFPVANTSGNADTYLSKLDAAGNFVWGGKFTNNPNVAAGVWPDDIAVDAAQNLYVTGSYVGQVDFDPGPGTSDRTSADDANRSGDGYVAQITPAGGLGYFVSVGSVTGREDGFGIAVDGAGNAYVAGEFNGSATISTPGGDAATLVSAGGYDAYAMKLTPTGGLAWARRWGSAGADSAQEIAHDGAGGLYVVGLFNGTVDLDPTAGVTTLTSGGLYDVSVSRLGTDGGFAWAVAVGGPDIEISNDIAVNGGGEVFVAGRYTGTADFDPTAGTFNLADAGGYDGFLAKLTQAASPNRAPVAGNDAYATDEDTTLRVAAPGLLGNDNDPDGNPLSITIVDGPANGTLDPTSGGAFVYIPKANFNGTDTFTYRVSDGSLTSNVATVTITVRPVNDAPVASVFQYVIDEDTPLTSLLGATDIDGDPLTFTIVNGPASGTVRLSPTAAPGTFTYIPNRNFNGNDAFTFKVNDGTTDSNLATIFIGVRPVNDAPFPFPVSQAASTNEDTPASGQLTARDVDGDPLSFSAFPEGQPAFGSVAINPDGTYTYTPGANFNGTDQFGFRVADPSGASGIGVVTVRVLPVNDAPVARDDSYTVAEDGVLSVSVGLLSRLRMVSEPGDWIGQGSSGGTQPLVLNYTTAASSFAARTNFDNGVEIRVADPNVVGGWTLNFAAPNDAPLAPGVYTGAMRFPFQAAGSPGLDVSGNGRGYNTLTGQFTVYDVAYGPSGTITRFAARFVQQGTDFDGSVDPPLTGEIAFNTTYGAAGGVLANDTDPDGEFLLTAELVAGPSHGVLDLNRDGTFTYTPAADFNGTDTFTYRASDGRGTSNTATVTLRVTPVNDAPVAASQALATNEDTALPGTLAAIDGDGDALTYAIVAAPQHGTLTAFNPATGAFTYSPNPNYNGADSFTFKVNDGAADSAVATVAITVRPVNDAPTAAGQALATDEDTALGGTLSGADVEGSPLTYAVVTTPAHGTLSLDPATGAFTYTPDADFNGADSFTFRANDGSLDSAAATVAITVRPVNDAPTAANGTFTLPEGSPNGALVGVFEASDVDRDRLTFALVAGNTGGAFAIDPATGRITVTDGRRLDYETTPQFVLTVRVTDPAGAEALATATINLTDVDENAPVVIDVRPGDSANTINGKSGGKLEVAILSSATFDARTIDLDSLRFGRTGTEDSASRHPRTGVRYRYEDLNGDGRLDLVVQFEIELTGFRAGDTVGTLTGQTLDGRRFSAQDRVTVKDPGKTA